MDFGPLIKFVAKFVDATVISDKVTNLISCTYINIVLSPLLFLYNFSYCDILYVHTNTQENEACFSDNLGTTEHIISWRRELIAIIAVPILELLYFLLLLLFNLIVSVNREEREKNVS